MANQQEAILVLKGEEITKLDELLGNTPTKYGLPIVNLLQAAAYKRQQEAQAASIQAEKEAKLTSDIPTTEAGEKLN